jgi:Ca2+-binding RTX toxin-like protein
MARFRPQLELLEDRRLLTVSIINGGGLGYAGNGGGGPPDVTGAAGPNSYLEVTNSTVTLFSPKPGGAILAQDGISDFFYNPAIGNQTQIDLPGSVAVAIAASPTGATEAGNTVTITTTVPHGFSLNQTVTVSGVGVAGYDGTFPITAVTATTFSYTDPTSGLADSGGGSATVDPGSCGVCDSTGLFDNLMGASGRFVIADIDVDQTTNVSQYLVAVSTTSNPTTFTTADWNFYHITTTEGPVGNSAWTDYPGNPGFNKDALVDTFNMFGNGPFAGNSQIVSIDATDLANGVPQASLHVFHNDRPGFSYRPTAMQDSVTGDPMWLIRNPNDGANIDVTKMTNVLSNSATFATTSLPLPASKNFVPSGINNPLDDDDPVVTYGDVDNPGNSPASDIDNRILNAGEYNNTVVAAHKVAVGTASVVSASVQISNGTPVGGSGYTVGDTLTVNGGTFTTAATLTVATLGAGGSVSTVTVADPGNYSSLAGIDGTVTGGSGSGAKFSINFRGELDVQWYAIDVSGGTPAFQLVGGSANVGRIGFGPNTYTVDPAININSTGEIGLGFMESDTVGGAANGATGGFLSTFVTARKPTDAAGTMQPIVLVPAGTGSGIITGRIGDFSGMNVDPVNGTFWHVNEFGGGGPTDIANFTPEDRPVVTAPSDQTALEGAAKSFNVGSFADADGGPWTVTVNWGDGSNTTFNVASAGSLGTQTHTYAEESAADHPGSNPYQVTVTVTDSTLLSDSNTFNVTVSDPDVSAVGGQNITPVEGASSGSVLLATFTDPGGPEAASNYSADIDWGDGSGVQIGAGTITQSGTSFEVRGTHTYAEESAADHLGSNPYQITVTVHHESTNPQTVTSTATVSDPAVVTTGGFAFTAVEGVPSATQTVATFTDPGGAEAVGDYSALIDWGDGTAPSVGTITLAAGVYTVQGSHTFAVGLGLPDDFGNTFCGGDPPSYHKAITVTISHEAAPTAQATSDATISIAPGTAHLAGGSLIVVATTADDHVVINPVGNTGAVRVALNSQDLGSFTLGSAGRIIVAGLAGNDDIQVAGGVRLGTVLYGGPGNDRLKGGNGTNILVGCDGNDELIGGNGDDLLIGGNGADRLIGGAGNDKLVSANIVNPITLVEDTKFSHLVAALNGGPIMADDDGDVDVLTGAAGTDTFFYNYTGNLPLDIVTDKAEIAFDV